MLKKATAIFMLIAIIFCLTGCMNIVCHITLNNNSSADIEYDISMYKSTIPAIMGIEEEAFNPFEEAIAKAEAEGYTVTSYETEEQIGFRAKSKNTGLNIQEIVQNIGLGATGNGGISVKKGLFTNTYTVSANIDTTNLLGDHENAQQMYPLIDNSISAKLIFTAPSEIISDTGTASDDGKTYEYRIEIGKDNTITLSYTAINIPGICLSVLLIAAVSTVLFIRFRKKKTYANEKSNRL